MFNIQSQGTDEWGQYTIIDQVEVIAISEEVRENSNKTPYVRCTINAGGNRFNGTIFTSMLKDYPVGSTGTFRVRSSMVDGDPVLSFSATYGESNNRNQAVVTSAMAALGLSPAVDAGNVLEAASGP